jgi:hypothetical protein
MTGRRIFRGSGFVVFCWFFVYSFFAGSGVGSGASGFAGSGAAFATGSPDLSEIAGSEISGRLSRGALRASADSCRVGLSELKQHKEGAGRNIEHSRRATAARKEPQLLIHRRKAPYIPSDLLPFFCFTLEPTPKYRSQQNTGQLVSLPVSWHAPLLAVSSNGARASSRESLKVAIFLLFYGNLIAFISRVEFRTRVRMLLLGCALSGTSRAGAVGAAVAAERTAGWAAISPSKPDTSKGFAHEARLVGAKNEVVHQIHDWNAAPPPVTGRRGRVGSLQFSENAFDALKDTKEIKD